MMQEHDRQQSWAVAKLVRHQALDLAFEGSSPSRPAIIRWDIYLHNRRRHRAMIAMLEGANV